MQTENHAETPDLPLPPLPPELEPRLLQLHAAIEVDDLWEATRDLLREAFPCVRVTLFLGHLGMGEARLVFTDPPLEADTHWYEERGKLNPFSPWIEKHVGADHYIFSEIVGPPETFHASTFYQRFAAREGWDKGLSGLFWHKQEVRAMFSLYRAPDQPDFTAADVPPFRSLMRHIGIAVERVQRLDREENIRKSLETFTRTMPLPLVLIDWERAVVFANRAAYESAANWNYGEEKARLYNSRDCFKVPTVILQQIDVLKKGIQATEPKILASSLPPPVTVTDPRNNAWKARVETVRIGRDSLARPGFFIQFIDPEGDAEPNGESLADNREGPRLSAARLRALSSLTPAERELVRYVCKGMSNREIARALNKSILTVKTQLNSIFQKLNIARRTQIVARFGPR
ncbi:MAG: helix-turn-helix transcriptional regulator [Opitutales bacterium]|nr:helix-turn-helix transcriptional regulator [Opitutales bacterium]